MNILQKFFDNKLNKIIQHENAKENRNQAALTALQGLGFSLPEIRKSLITLNGIKICELAKEDGICALSLYNTFKGTRENPKAIKILCGTLGLQQEDLFPEQFALARSD